MDTEFIKLLQNSDQHSEEYRTRLRNNQSILEIFKIGVEWAEAKVKEFGEAKDEKEKNDLNDLKQQVCQMYILVVKECLYQIKIFRYEARDRIPTVKLKIPGKGFLKSESRTSVTFKL